MNDKKQGTGIYHFLNGQRYEGEFNDNKIDGKGKLYKKDQLILEGFWSKGQFVSD